MGLDDCRIIGLPRRTDSRGSLTVIEVGDGILFDIRRVFYIHDIPKGAERGGHAHRNLEQFIIAVQGSFDVVLDDGSRRKRFHLDNSFHGLYIGRMIWKELDNFSPGSICLCLASTLYDESDYFRDYSAFLEAIREAGGHSVSQNPCF